jgi:geranylgeranyl reductase family protein
MVRCDALIVGGGPAGSTCARLLRAAGWTVIVLDRAQFPREKVCAGWVTPGVFRLLDLQPAEYAATGRTLQPIRGFATSVLERRAPAIVTRYPDVVSYGIRRVEFDDYLLRRSGARVHMGTPLHDVERRRDRWHVNGAFETPVVIGAGGHFCPIARRLGRDGATPAARTAPVVAREAEFRLTDPTTTSGDVPELFFCRDLQGYGWCVRKGAFLNIGIGRRESSGFNAHVREFVRFLARTGRAPTAGEERWCGHAYLAAGTGPRTLTADGMLLVGDAAGLAYPESGEGIKPAVDSGRLAAETLIAAGGRVERAALEPYARTLQRRYPPAVPPFRALAPVTRAVGRALLGSPAFTRHVVLDRWFLRQEPSAAQEPPAVIWPAQS